MPRFGGVAIVRSIHHAPSVGPDSLTHPPGLSPRVALDREGIGWGKGGDLAFLGRLWVSGRVLCVGVLGGEFASGSVGKSEGVRG